VPSVLALGYGTITGCFQEESKLQRRKMLILTSFSSRTALTNVTRFTVFNSLNLDLDDNCQTPLVYLVNQSIIMFKSAHGLRQQLLMPQCNGSTVRVRTVNIIID